MLKNYFFFLLLYLCESQCLVFQLGGLLFCFIWSAAEDPLFLGQGAPPQPVGVWETSGLALGLTLRHKKRPFSQGDWGVFPSANRAVP